MKKIELQNIVNNGGIIDLDAMHFCKETLSNQGLHSSVFNQCVFEDMHFTVCDFTGSYFFDCRFIRCSFIDSTLHKCEWYTCQMSHNTWEQCLLTKSDFHQCNFGEASFHRVNFGWSFLNECDLREVELDEVNLEGAVISASKMYNSKKHKIFFGESHPAKIQDIDMSVLGDHSKIMQQEEFIKFISVN